MKVYYKEIFYPVIFILLIIGFSIYLGFFKSKENFGKFEYNDQHIILQKKPCNSHLDSGSVYKYKYPDNNYMYMYKFNLPNPIGGDYNKIQGKYKVFIGKDIDSLFEIGNLERFSDGWFYLNYKSDVDYKYSKIIFSVDEDPSKNKIICEKKLN